MSKKLELLMWFMSISAQQSMPLDNTVNAIQLGVPAVRDSD
jgi:hypothetical protein